MSQAMQDAKAALNALLEDARSGNMIPVRVPDQIKAVQELLEKAESDHAEQIAVLKSAPDGKGASMVQENAEFMRTAIHELRTPMTNIRGYTDMLSNPAMAGELTAMQSQLLEVVRTNSKRMETLLMDMSHINKLRAGMVQTSNKLDTFKNITLMVEKQARPIAESLNRQLTFDIPDGLPLLQTDGELLALSMVKLIENGLRYSPEGSGLVMVTAHGNDKTLTISIKDNGIGMSEDEIGQLGTLFFRANHDTVRTYKGSGLGVPIAYGFIKTLGGTISVESTPEQGSCFRITMEGMA